MEGSPCRLTGGRGTYIQMQSAAVGHGRRRGVWVRLARIATLLVLTLLPVEGAEGQDAKGRRKDAPESPDLMTLERAVGIALDRNRDIADARYGLEVAEEQVSEAWGNVFPTVDFSASYTRNISPAKSFLPAFIFDPDADPDEFIQVQFGADNAWNTSINLEQPLFSARAFIGVGAAGRFKALQEELVRGRIQSVVTRVRVAYYELLLAQEQVRLTENSVGRVRQSLEETRALNRAGLAADYDVLRLEVELANLEPNLRRARNAVSQSRRALGVELSLEDVEGLEVAGSLAVMELDDVWDNTPANEAILSFAGVDATEAEQVDEVISMARSRRSDLRQLELTESLRRTEMRLEQVEYLPRVSLFGNYVLQAQQNGSPDFFGTELSRASAKAIGVSVSVPIFQGFQRDARVDQKRAALRQAETQTRWVREQAEIQVKALVEQAEESRLRAQGQRMAVRQAQRGFEIASAQYREGLGSQLELTDSEVALRQSEFNYAQAVYDYLVARARLDEATGTVPMVDRTPGVSPAGLGGAEK